MVEPLNGQLANIGSLVHEAARRLYEECGASDDFEVQEISQEQVVYGNKNRVIFDGERFTLDREHCSERFRFGFIRRVLLREGLIRPSTKVGEHSEQKERRDEGTV